MKIFYIQITLFLAIFLSANSAFAKPKIAKELNIAIDSSYFLEIPASVANCEKIIEGSCFFRDKKTDETPYFHQTDLVVFQSKIIAFQTQNDTVKIFKIKDSSYKLSTKNQNTISFEVENGEVKNLILTKGILENEKQEVSDCAITKFLYDFYTLHDSQKTHKEYGFFNDEYDFTPFSEFIVFAPKTNSQKIMAVVNSKNNEFDAIKNLKLCKFPGEDKALVKHTAPQDCMNTPINDECRKLQYCQDYLEIEECKVVNFSGFKEE